ncbi:hypothetical protein OHB26_33065 [Nocardia sp. NBC_01503]|uniref:IclR family transcriptional regulator domain-containing protein n=1 Tax=Nocardia sp. NBC_01503 TaxID=2975997 RepID=UPI002E7AB5B3|nr:IclR family transcriptional regulator C-terminal domain-containing protein [Nocardia sp. NBC_01503]WTL31687.1 hypothetical protein OHB26_33065 [Nocardia sp. NBC_01503]
MTAAEAAKGRTGGVQSIERAFGPAEFTRQLEAAARTGFAMDDGEQELGVRCVAVSVPNAPAPLAISISGPVGRMSQDLVDRAVPLLTEVSRALSAELR